MKTKATIEASTILFRKDGDGESYEVVEAVRVGQRYRTDDEGYSFPEYLYTLRVIASYKTMGQAQAFARGTLRSAPKLLHSLDHPTSVSSMGDPGRYPLDKNGGPLFTVVEESR